MKLPDDVENALRAGSEKVHSLFMGGDFQPIVEEPKDFARRVAELAYKAGYNAGAKAQLAAMDEYERHSGQSERREYSKSMAIRLYPGDALFIGPHEPVKWEEGK